MKNLKLKILLITLSGSFYTASSLANNDLGGWQPQIVEKMYVLPPKHLNKVLNNDFNSSSLALNLQSTDSNIKSKIKKINDLKKMLPGLSSEETMEINHQIIVNKRDYIKDMNNLLKMKKQKLNTKKIFFKKIETKLKNKKITNKVNSKFFENKKIAMKRSQEIDFKVLEDTSNDFSSKSKYFEQYQINKDAVKKLQLAIEKHPMNKHSILSKNPQNKLEAINNFVHSIDSEIAVLDMKEQMISYMAKIVALDAMSLAESVTQIADNQNQNKIINYNDPINAISFFTE